jgi:hypothetical protein
MNKFYVITPLVLCALFGVYYFNFAQEQQIKEAQKKKEVAAKIAEEKRKKDDIEAKARADADERTRKREEETAKKEADRRAKWDAQGQEIADATKKYTAQAEASAKQVADLEAQLVALRKQKETSGRESFELLKKVELARIDKRNAELEIQRIHAMVAKRATESSAAQLPPRPAVAKAP